ncbi:hypothetical protein PLA107_006150 [Pseudomonas amygdali pv. lachrymans str. M301315]|uniref:Uncharacterized protein n=1 Tax=Pseudomonas amygdali pv. lachrymans str. M301315 TaxID=629260 RepID=A0AAD0M3D1_PSEAV|nr:hypothetical protein PLA107_006150 [Pseudomonas amygdali pv. lachrymans str. M301315]PWD00175.1 hypothetical protein CX658_24610 [Pseudomonas amygdali pv. lachrymans]
MLDALRQLLNVRCGVDL